MCGLINLCQNWVGNSTESLTFHVLSHHLCDISGGCLQDKDLKWLTVALHLLKHLKYLDLSGECALIDAFLGVMCEKTRLKLLDALI